MKRQEWRDLIDKSKWPSGEWNNEPDKAQWPDEATGLPCLAVRNNIGNWCGYVGVPEGHPAFGQHYENVDVHVHGGLTFSDRCHEGTHEPRICHIVEMGEHDVVWWLGFDCAHFRDLVPGMGDMQERWESEYRTLDYVRKECTELAAQLMSGEITGHAHGEEGDDSGGTAG